MHCFENGRGGDEGASTTSLLFQCNELVFPSAYTVSIQEVLSTVKMREPLRVAILECDEPIGKTKERYGGYGAVFEDLLDTSANEIATIDRSKKPQLELSRWDIVNSDIYPNLDNVDAVLMTGSSMSRQRWKQDCACFFYDAKTRRQNTTPSTMIRGLYDLSTLSRECFSRTE